MNGFGKKTHKTSRGFTYTYYTFSGDKSLPVLVFQHGWPDHAAMWADVAGPLRSTNHSMIIPDMLGYDGTDKPTDVAAYRWDGMTQDIIDLVDAEGYEKVVSIGHDWGSGCASHLYHYFPKRVVGLVNLNVAYSPPARKPFDLEAINQLTQKIFGYPVFSYWGVTAGPDGPELLKSNVDRFFQAMHGPAESMKKIFTGPGAFREVSLVTSPHMTIANVLQVPQERR